MSVRKSTAYRITMIVLSLACLAGAGYLVYRTYFVKDSPDKLLTAAKKRYADGQAAEKAKQSADAAAAYAEAAVHAENGLKAVDARVKSGGLAVEEANPLLGEFWLLRARATRDREFARAAAEGKPLEETKDTTLNEMYRSYGALRDDKDLVQCISDLRAAFVVFPDEPELVKESLRTELTVSPIDWPQVAKVSASAKKLSTNDPRANYCLARNEFQKDGPRAADKSADSVKAADAYLTVAENNNAPYWRSVWLRLQILRWYVESESQPKKKGKAPEERVAALRAKLFEPKAGVLDRAAAGEAFAPLSSFDIEGLAAVHPFALRVLLSDPSRPPDAADVRRVCESAFAAGHKLAASESKDLLPQVGASIAEVVSLAAPVLAKASAADRDAVSKGARDFFAQHPTAVGGTAAVRVALLTAEEAAAARKRGDAAGAKDLHDKAVAALESGLKAAAEQKRVPDQIEYRLALLEVKWSDGTKPEEIEPHVAALRTFDSPQAKGVANFYDAHLAMRRGQLEKARQFFDAVLKDKSIPGFALRAHTSLAELALGLSEPGAATVHLQQLADAFRRIDSLSSADRQALEARFAGPDDVTALQVVATLSAGLQRLERESRGNPGQALDGKLKADILRPVEALVKTLRVPLDKVRPSPDRSARLALVQFRTTVGDRAEAAALLDTLAADYPQSADVLRARVAFALLPAAGATQPDPDARGKADALIQNFVRDNPEVRAGKLFWAEWLVRTGRGKDADEYLRNPVHFPDQTDLAIERLRAGALFQEGRREEAVKLLAGLPADPSIDWVLLQSAATRDTREAVLRTALGRYENNGLFRIYEAATRLADNKYEEAAAGLLAVVEYTALRRTARALLERTLVSYAGYDLKAATAFVARLANEYPAEPAVYVGMATTARLNEEVGEPGDAWPAKRTMYAGLNKWEELSRERPGQAGISPLDAGLTRIQFHLLAGNPVAARQEGDRLRVANKDSLDLLFKLTELYLSEPDPQPKKAEEYLAAAFKLAPPDSVRLLALDAAVKERSGDVAAALGVYQRMTALFPNDMTGFANRVRLATAQGKAEDAAKWAVEWAEKQPTNDYAVLELVYQYWTTGAKPAALREADGFVTRIVERVTKQAAGGTPDPKAEPVGKRVAAARATANRALASTFFRAKAFDEAGARVTAALTDAPADVGTRMLAGDVALARKDWDEAAAAYKAVLADDESSFVAANNLAWVLATKKNQPADALALVEKARTRKGSAKPIGAERLPAEFLDTIGAVYTALAKADKFPEMRDLFEAAVRRYPGDPRLHFWLAEAHAALGEASKATARYEVAARLCERPAAGVSDDDRKTLREKATAKLKKPN